MHPLFKMALHKAVQDSDCTCFAEPIHAFQRRELVSNGKTLHVYRYCKFCGAPPQSSVTRETISFLQDWRARLIESRREVIDP